jgi:uncharacterized protein YprB with RNaseH-like and TPR domain
MSDIQDRLRRLSTLRSSSRNRNAPVVYTPLEEDAPPEFDDRSDAEIAARTAIDPAPTANQRFASAYLSLLEAAPGREVATQAGLCYCRLQAYPLATPRGPEPLGKLLDISPDIFHRFHPQFGLQAMRDYRRAAFIDTETTGLGGGAGVYCFMVGVGTFEAWQPDDPAQLPSAPDLDATPTHFVVRQYFMRNPAEERSLLLALADQLAPYAMTVTFNGRAFDLPLLRTRYAQNRRMLPLAPEATDLLRADRPHLDLLMPARKLWRRRLQSCRLIHLEQQILGLYRTEEDVEGRLIPELYQAYVQTGNAAALRGVFYHNAEDIVSMAALAEQLGRAFTEGEAPAAQTGRAQPVVGLDWVGIAQAHEHTGNLALAEAAYRHALSSVSASAARGETFRRLGELLKRQARWPEAAELWQQWLTSVPGVDPTPYEELAKYCEWQLHDYTQATMWTSWALHNLTTAPRQTLPAARRHALEHRLARLQHKASSSSAA